tara:strand:- start:36 stop:860 length:825 start_codon:yes stop_codon:yes gene_type:complete
MDKYKNKIKCSFNNKAYSYDEYALVQIEVANRIYKRLSTIKIQPKNILDIGSGTGHLSDMLSKLFPKANIICLDISLNMLQESYKKNSRFKCVQSDAENMPFKENQFDLVVSSFTLHWCYNVEKIFFDTYRILRSKGLFLFTTVGPSTLEELKAAYQSIDDKQHINKFSDMHIYGDLLLKYSFQDPVMDLEKIIIEYSSLLDVLDSLKKTGANIVLGQEPLYFKKNIYQKLTANYPVNKDNKRLPVTYEMIYGTAWKDLINSDKNTGVIPIKKI